MSLKLELTLKHTLEVANVTGVNVFSTPLKKEDISWGGRNTDEQTCA